MIAQDLIQESVKNEKIRIGKARRDDIRRMVDYYTDTETDKYGVNQDKFIILGNLF